MEEELLVNQVKTNTIQLALQYIMSKLEINAENLREESEVNFTFSKQSKASNLGTGQTKVKPVFSLWFQ